MTSGPAHRPPAAANHQERDAAARKPPRGQRLVLNVDGASRGNPGPAAFGVASEDGSVALSVAIGKATNNEAEWQGFLAALRHAVEKAAIELVIRADSELVIKQFNGQYKVKAEHLKAYLSEARELAAKIPKVVAQHVPREQNRKADALANAALDALK
ncbi:MAG: ribonuclease HI family protein [Thermoanaerobaculia bacterium]|nr:Ribonuclease H [Thermoanaerobaculia bacterium]MCK6681969.1 ribonuclease HI family protein [Thermoanaerobaculia bacterium]